MIKNISVKNKVRKMNKLRISILLLVATMIIILPAISSLHTGKGELCKGVFWEDGTPILNATVGLDTNGDEIINNVVITNNEGVACFSGLPYRTYYIYVDYDNDGIWDTVGEPVIVDQEHIKIRNLYNLPPEVWRHER